MMNLISWTGWTKEDWINAGCNLVGGIIALFLMILVCAFVYGIWFTLAFFAGC